MVLGVGLVPPRKAERIAEIFGVELDAHGFCRTDPARPMETTRPGIFVSGGLQ